jgi:hypothetical protein
MNQNKKYTAYCGLFCLDCIPSDKRLFETIDEIETLLIEIKFDKYAELKSKNNETFKNYSKFLDVLKEMKNLECKYVCTEGGCKEDCKIRECVEEKQYEGCWECDDFKECQLLEHLKKIHPIEHNLKMIKKYGVNDWARKRKPHYFWL